MQPSNSYVKKTKSQFSLSFPWEDPLSRVLLFECHASSTCESQSSAQIGEGKKAKAKWLTGLFVI
jgi:hypothetical protein